MAILPTQHNSTTFIKQLYLYININHICIIFQSWLPTTSGFSEGDGMLTRLLGNPDGAESDVLSWADRVKILYIPLGMFYMRGTFYLDNKNEFGSFGLLKGSWISNMILHDFNVYRWIRYWSSSMTHKPSLIQLGFICLTCTLRFAMGARVIQHHIVFGHTIIIFPRSAIRGSKFWYSSYDVDDIVIHKHRIKIEQIMI